MIGQDPLQKLSNGSYRHTMDNNEILNRNDRFTDNDSSENGSTNNGSCKEQHKRSTETLKPRRGESTVDSHTESNDMDNLNQNENEDDGSNEDTTNETPKAPRRRSKQGCLTCKIRKKRCDEMKPTCGDCARLGRRCEYITDDMSSEQIKILKFEMESLEEDSKARRRKPRPKKSLQGENGSIHINNGINNGINKANGEKKHHNDNTRRQAKKRRKVQDDDKVVFNPLALDMINIEKVYAPMSTMSQIDGILAPTILPSTGLDLKQQVNNYNNKINNDHSNNTNNNNIWEAFLDNNQILPSPFFNSSVSPKLTPTSNPSDQFQLQYDVKCHEQQQQQQQQQLQNSMISHPLSNIASMARTNTPYDDMDSLTQIFSPAISAFFQNHLQNDTRDDDNIVKAREQPAKEEKQEAIMTTTNDDPSSKNKIPSEVIRQLQELFEFAPNMKRPPEIYINPSIVKNSPLESLSPMGKQLYDYYRDRLCTVVSSAPKYENMYLNTFLPMAHADISVLYGILAWSAFHLGGPRMEKQGNFYIQKAIERFSNKPVLSSEGVNFYKDVVEEIDIDDPVLSEEKLYDQSNSETVSTLSPDDILNMRLASFLILCGVEICKGDVSRWSKYLNYGAELIRHKGGISKFNGSKDEHFLATNYAYHDITSASVASERNLHFDLNEYEEMWVASNQMGFVDPLHGISSPIFKIIAEINKLAMDSRIMLRRSTHIIDDDSGEEFSGSDDDDGLDQDGGIRLDESPSVIERQQIGKDEAGKSPESTTSSSQGWYQKHIKESLRGATYSSMPEIYDEVMAKVYKIDSKLNTARPNQEALGEIKSSDLELQLTMFECFQLTAKIHLRQSVIRINSSSLEIQYLLSQLVKSLDVLLGSSVEACLCFPLFIAGMNCINPKDQRQMNKRLDEFVKRYRWKNVKRCQIVMTQVWKMNHGGDRCIDWYEIVRKLGWDLSFA